MTAIKAWMEENEYTNSTLAARLGVSYELIYKVAEGLRPVSDGLKWRFAREFGVDVAERIAAQRDPEPTAQ